MYLNNIKIHYFHPKLTTSPMIHGKKKNHKLGTFHKCPKVTIRFYAYLLVYFLLLLQVAFSDSENILKRNIKVQCNEHMTLCDISAQTLMLKL